MQTHASPMHDQESIDAQLTMILDGNNLLDILTALKNASIYDFLSSLLASPALTSHPSVQKLISDLPDILQMLGGHPAMSK